jgi:hypothetical protein
MSDLESSSNPSSLDQKVDRIVETPKVSAEQFENNVAGTPNPVSDTSATDVGRSQTMSEIERMVSNDILTTRQRKLSQFGISANRSNDFRLRDFTKRLGRQLEQEFESEIKTGPISQRVRHFDVQSQTMRMITANASLSSYQFQKQQTLPFMRKTLALDYAKVDILKRISGGISALERAVVSKLEAIKMNTAGSVPKQEGLFATIRKEVRDQNIKRIAGNISNLVMDRYDEKYTKHVSPILTRLNKIMGDTSAKGGINGVSSAVSVKLNNIRHQLNKSEGKTDAPTTLLGRIQARGTKAASSVLGGAVRMSQNFKLPEKLNGFASKHLQTHTDFLDRLKPFAPNDRDPARSTGDDAHPTPGTDLVPTVNQSPFNRMLKAMGEWRIESGKRQANLLEHVKAIREHVSPSKALPGKTAVARKLRGRKAKTLPSAPAQAQPAVARRLGVPDISIVRGRQKPRADIVDVMDQDPKSPGKKSIFGKLFSSMTERLSKIDLSIKEDNKARGLFEKAQAARQRLVDKLAEKAKIRKNSYEDLQAKRAAAKNAKMGPWGARMGSGVTAAAAARMAAATEGAKEPGLIKGAISDMMDSAKDKAKTAAAAAAGASWKSIKRGGKFVRRNGIKGGIRAARLGAKGLFRGGKLGGRVAGRGLLGTLKFGGKIGGKGLLAAGKTAVKLGKGGLGIGLAAAVGQHFFDKSGVKGETKRVGDTAFEMAQYGSLGAGIGSLFGGIGAVPGAAIGAGVGAIVANSDRVSQQISGIGDKIEVALFGKKAQMRMDGTVLRQKQSSLFGDIKIAFMGQKARYSSTGQVVIPERDNIIGNVKYGFQKFFFGDKFNNGEYKPGTSITEIVGNSISKTMSDMGKELKALPSAVKKGFFQLTDKANKAAANAKDGIVSGTKNAGEYLNKKATDVKLGAAQLGVEAANVKSKFTMENIRKIADNAGKVGAAGLYFMSTGNFNVGASSAILGWNQSKNKLDDPASPFYAYVTETLSAYGVKNRSMYTFINSLEVSQDKVNSGKIKPFDDSDLAFMAVRFGFDSKNKDALNYFKLWYKRRFMPAMGMIGTILKRHRFTFGSIVSADPKVLTAIAMEIKREIDSSDIKKTDLEPSGQAYNKYAKIGNQDPGKTSPANLTQSKPFDPRDPRNAANDNNKTAQGQSAGQSWASKFASFFGFGGTTSSSSSGSGQPGEEPTAQVSRKNGTKAKGTIKDQPEYKSAYSKLPRNLKQLVDKSKSLQFVLWSTSVQHGPDMAAAIFQKDYNSQLDEKGYIRSIYQDRSTKFSGLAANDRIEAMGRIGSETNFALGIQAGTNNPSMDQMYDQAGKGVIDPNGNYTYGGAPTLLKGPVKARANQAIQYLMSKNYSKIAAMGIVANLVAESSLQPGETRGDGGKAHGIAQWHPDRRQKIQAHFGKTVESMGLREQLDAVDWEIRSGNGVTGGKNLFGDLNAAKSVASSVAQFVDRFERPKDRSGEKSKRTNIALGLMKSIGSDGSGVEPKQGGGESFTPAGARGGAKPPASGGGQSSDTPSKQRQTAPKTKKPNSHELAMREHTQSMRSFTEAFASGATIQNGPKPHGGGTQVLVNSPMINHQSGGPQEHFVTMSMRKNRRATGE